MLSLPDDALVVRGGLNLVETLKIGSGVTIDGAGNLQGLSVNSAPGKTVAELAEGLRYGRSVSPPLALSERLAGTWFLTPAVSTHTIAWQAAFRHKRHTAF